MFWKLLESQMEKTLEGHCVQRFHFMDVNPDTQRSWVTGPGLCSKFMAEARLDPGLFQYLQVGKHWVVIESICSDEF